MSLKKLELKGTYDSIVDDLYNDFFNRVLSESKQCSRVGGFFTSRNFAACADGLSNFIKNDGTMKLVLTPFFTSEDVDAIKQGLSTKEDKIVDNWIHELGQIKEKFEEDHTKALAWMLKNDLLEIRVAVLVDEQGQVVKSSEIDNMGIFKRKTGIFHGNETDEIISFQGNIDFNDKLMGEYYHIDVFRYWDPSEQKWVNEHYREFQQYWKADTTDFGKYKIQTIPLPEAIRNNLIKIAPESKSEISLKKLPELRPYQKKAVKNWMTNNCMGIFEMATGTGKTFTAIGCINELKTKINDLIVVLVCPYTPLLFQWKRELEKDNFAVIPTSENPSWQTQIKDMINLMNFGKYSGIRVIATTYATFSNEKFIKILENSKVPIMLLADEVHHAGSFEHRSGLVAKYQYRLGLTATLERYFDDVGTKILIEYFGDTVFEYDLKKAIDNGILVGYYYHPIYVSLTEDEYLNYQKESRTIAVYYSSKNPDDQEKLERALLRRANIIRNAKNKMDKFKQLVDKQRNLKHTLIYCSDKQIDEVQKILMNRIPQPITNRRITAYDPAKYEERLKILDGLAQEHYQAIVAIGVLDEGVDVPQARNCILLASTGNPKQFIQRRGRVLRKFFGKYNDGTRKEFATIYDLLVMPRLSDNMSEQEKKIEYSIIKSQIKRQIEMASIAINSTECMEEIHKIEKSLNVA